MKHSLEANCLFLNGSASVSSVTHQLLQCKMQHEKEIFLYLNVNGLLLPTGTTPLVLWTERNEVTSKAESSSSSTERNDMHTTESTINQTESNGSSSTRKPPTITNPTPPPTTTNGYDDIPTAEQILSMILGQPLNLRISASCSLTIENSDCIFSISTSPEGCLKVSESTSKLIPSIGLSSVYSVANDAVGLIGFVDASLDKCKRSISISAATTDELEILHEMTLKEARLSLESSLDSPFGVSFSLAGKWSVGNIEFVAVVEKNEEGLLVTGDTVFQFTLRDLMDSLVSDSILNADQRRDVLSNLKMDVLDAVSITSVGVDLQESPQGLGARVEFTFEFPGLGTTKTSAVINRPIAGSLSTVMSLAILKISLAAVIDKMTGVDISDVPIIGSLTLDDVTVSYASSNITGSIIPIGLDPVHDSDIKEGLHFLFNVRFDPSDPAKTFHLECVGGTFNFDLIGDPLAIISDILSREVQNLSVPVPPGVDAADFLSSPFRSMRYDSSKEILYIPATSNKTIVLVPSLLEFRDVFGEFSLSTGSGQTRRLSFDLYATWELGQHDIGFKVSRPAGENIFIGEARPPFDIPIESFISQFGGNPPGGDLENGLASLGLSSFVIKNSTASVYFRDGNALRALGTASIGSYDLCDIEVIVGQLQGTPLMAYGSVLNKAPLTGIVKSLTQGAIDLTKAPGSMILDNTDVGLIISSMGFADSKKYIRFTTKNLKDIDIVQGLNIFALLSIPDDCAGDHFCSVLQNFFGQDFQIHLKGTVEPTSAILKAYFDFNINLFHGATLDKLGLKVQASFGGSISVVLFCTLNITDPALVLTGGFGVSTSGDVILEMSMSMWDNAFGLSFLSLGDLDLSITIDPKPKDPEPIKIKKLKLGGSARIGLMNNSNAELIKAAMYLNIDLKMPLKNYLFGNVSKLTLPSILAAFDYRPSLPNPFFEIGYPDGANVSFAPVPMTLPNGVKIPFGLALNGSLQILDFRLNSELRFNEDGIKISMMRADPFDMGGGLISVSNATGQAGPKFLLDVSWNPGHALIEISGRVTVLNISAAIDIYVDESGMHFELEGKFLDLFECSLEISSNYQSFASLDFGVKGGFKQDLFDKLNAEVQAILDDYRKQADAAIESAEQDVRNAQAKFDDANDALDHTKDDVNERKSAFTEASNAVRSKEADVDNAQGAFDDAVGAFDDAQQGVASANAKLERARQDLRNKQNSCPSLCRRSECDSIE